MQTARNRMHLVDGIQSERAGISHRPRDLERELAPAVLDACHLVWKEFAELSGSDPSAFPDDEQDLLRWYAELQFRLGGGGGRCVECRAHVRHALPLRAEMSNGSIREFLCLCTRCVVAIEHDADRIWYMVGDQRIEHPIRCRRFHRRAA